MKFASTLALIFLTLTGYSSGAELRGKNKQVSPNLLDLAVVVALWMIALVTRSALGSGLALLVWTLASLMVGIELTSLRISRYPDREQKTPSVREDVTGLRRWWEGWKAFAAEMGNYQGRLLLALFYFVVVTPFGIAVRLFSDPLQLRRTENISFWVERELFNHNLEDAKEQF
jgi:hypothetical protein